MPGLFGSADGRTEQKNRVGRPGEIRDMKLVGGSRSFHRRLNCKPPSHEPPAQNAGLVHRRIVKDPIASDGANQPSWAARWASR